MPKPPALTDERVIQEDRQIPVRDGSTIGVRIYRPRDQPSTGKSPLIVTYHGGGWSVGDLGHFASLLLEVTTKFGMVCVDVDYRLAPEHKFPTAAHDCIDATIWATKNAASLNADPAQGFLIAGDSAGGNLVGAVAHTWVTDKHQPKLTGTHYVVPALCDPSCIPEKYKHEYNACEQNRDAPILNSTAMEIFHEAYVPEAKMRSDPLFSPLIWPGGHAGQPPASFQVCGQDLLRDDGLIYEKVLRTEYGIPTKMTVYPGLPHGFWLMMPQIDASKKYVKEFMESIAWLLERK